MKLTQIKYLTKDSYYKEGIGYNITTVNLTDYSTTFLGAETVDQELDYSGFYPGYFNPEPLETTMQVRFLVESNDNTVHQNISNFLSLFYHYKNELPFDAYTFSGIIQGQEIELINNKAATVTVSLKGHKCSTGWTTYLADLSSSNTVTTDTAYEIYTDIHFVSSASSITFYIGSNMYTMSGLTAGKTYWLNCQTGILKNITDNVIESEKWTAERLPVLYPGNNSLTSLEEFTSFKLAYRARYI